MLYQGRLQYQQLCACAAKYRGAKFPDDVLRSIKEVRTPAPADYDDVLYAEEEDSASQASESFAAMMAAGKKKRKELDNSYHSCIKRPNVHVWAHLEAMVQRCGREFACDVLHGENGHRLVSSID